MKKAFTAIALILCCLFALSACDYTPSLYYQRRALKIETECAEYSLKLTQELSEGEAAYKITDKDYVEREFLLNPGNDSQDDIVFYNKNGMYVYISRRILHIFNNGAFYELSPKYFREKSQAYNKIERIWADKYDDVEPSDIPNYIVGAVAFDGNLFILAQNEILSQFVFDREHTANLWKFDPSNGELSFCGFCVDGNNELYSFGKAEIAIVKN